MPASNLYESDFHHWTIQQSQLLKEKQWNELDFIHLAEEIEDMGRNLRRELESRLKILIMHLLKWKYQPDLRGNSWKYSVEEQREQIVDHLQDNPSLKHNLSESLARAYRYAVTLAAKETGYTKSVFPTNCPWSFDQIMNPDFWPEKKQEL